MNEEIILSMVKPYIKEGAITYGEFDQLFSILSRKEQYTVSEVLFNNGIDLVDSHVAEDDIVLDIDIEDELAEDFSADDFEILYDEDLFRDKKSGNTYFEELVLNKKVRQSNEILCYLIQQGNRQAEQDLCIKNRGLVDKYVFAYEKRYANKLDSEDLEQVGFMGLIKAAQKYDLKLGGAFSTYAVYWIKQAISREIMDHGYAIRIPVHMMERINKIARVSCQLLQELGRNPSPKEIAEEMELSEAQVRDCIVFRDNYLSYVSLDIPIGEDQDSTLGEFIPMDDALSVEQIVFNKELRQELEAVMDTLTPREQGVIKLRFGWDDNRSRTLEEVGARYGLTRERIRQIEARVFRKLKHPSRSRRFREFMED